jgi:hypothetical protein
MGMDRKGLFTTAKAQLQAQSEHDSMVKVLFLRGKLNRLWKTFNDKVLVPPSNQNLSAIKLC